MPAGSLEWVIGLFPVVRHQPGKLILPVWINRFDGQGCAAMKFCAWFREQRMIGHLHHYRVLEGIDRFRIKRLLIKKFNLIQRIQAIVEFGSEQIHRFAQNDFLKLLADYRRRLKNLFRRLSETVYASRQHGLYGVRQRLRFDGFYQPVGTALTCKIAGFHQGADQFFDEKGIAQRTKNKLLRKVLN